MHGRVARLTARLHTLGSRLSAEHAHHLPWLELRHRTHAAVLGSHRLQDGGRVDAELRHLPWLSTDRAAAVLLADRAGAPGLGLRWDLADARLLVLLLELLLKLLELLNLLLELLHQLMLDCLCKQRVLLECILCHQRVLHRLLQERMLL